MIFFKYSLITFTTLSVAIWAMPVMAGSSDGSSTSEKVPEVPEVPEYVAFAHPDPKVVSLRGKK